MGWQQKIELAQQHTTQNKINIVQKYNWSCIIYPLFFGLFVKVSCKLQIKIAIDSKVVLKYFLHSVPLKQLSQSGTKQPNGVFYQVQGDNAFPVSLHGLWTFKWHFLIEICSSGSNRSKDGIRRAIGSCCCVGDLSIPVSAGSAVSGGGTARLSGGHRALGHAARLLCRDEEIDGSPALRAAARHTAPSQQGSAPGKELGSPLSYLCWNRRERSIFDQNSPHHPLISIHLLDYCSNLNLGSRQESTKSPLNFKQHDTTCNLLACSQWWGWAVNRKCIPGFEINF